MSDLRSLAGYQPGEVVIGDVKYQTVPLVRSVLKKGMELDEAYESAEEPDAVVAAIGAMLDLRLKPVVKGTSKPSTVVKRMWNADETTLEWITDLLSQVQEADRPT